MLTARMRRVSGDTRQRRAPPLFSRGRWRGVSAGAADPVCLSSVCLAVASAVGSTVAISVPDAIQRFDLRKVVVDGLKFLAQPLDVAVDRAIVHIDVLAIGRVHQLVAVLDVAGTVGERLED